MFCSSGQCSRHETCVFAFNWFIDSRNNVIKQKIKKGKKRQEGKKAKINNTYSEMSENLRKNQSKLKGKQIL